VTDPPKFNFVDKPSASMLKVRQSACYWPVSNRGTPALICAFIIRSLRGYRNHHIRDLSGPECGCPSRSLPRFWCIKRKRRLERCIESPGHLGSSVACTAPQRFPLSKGGAVLGRVIAQHCLGLTPCRAKHPHSGRAVRCGSMGCS